MLYRIEVVCVAFDITVSETKTEVKCLRTKEMPETTTVIFSVEAVGEVYITKRTSSYTSGERQSQRRPWSIEVDQRIRNAWCSFRKYTLELYDRLSASLLELKIRMLRTEVLETML